MGYYEDKKRFESIYTSDYIKNLKEENYTKPRDETLKQEIAKYEYSENPTALEIVSNKNIQKDEPYIRNRFARDVASAPRQASFSHWESNYDHDNREAEEKKNSYSFRPSSIDDHFKKRYHKYHPAYYRTEGTQYSGVYGDNPFEKFFLHDQPKIHSSNYKLGMGTTKPTTVFIPGYGGYVPVNRFEYNMDYLKDPYFNVNKTNHLLNYMVRIPNYKGYVPKSVTNIKGNQRPHCFSTAGEDFS